jgi:crotonobetainyl-CoA:carnitine CoA-transferase CaiB-like acyl-CoA transferase
MSGFRYLSGEPDRPPVRVGISIGDALAGTQGLVGALMALWSRDRPGGTGRGQVVDVALYEAMWMYMESLAAEFTKLDRTREPTGPLLPGIAPSSVYPTLDGDWLIIGANQDSVFRRLASAMGRDDWLADDSPYRNHELRGAAQAELDEAVGAWTSGLRADDLLAVLAEAGVPSGRIYTARDIVGDPHYAAREMIVDVPDPGLGGETVPMPGVVPKLSATPGELTRGAPLLGEHNHEVFGALLTASDLDDLQIAGAL